VIPTTEQLEQQQQLLDSIAAQVATWKIPAHEKIDLRTVAPEDLGLDPYDMDSSLVKAIYKAQDTQGNAQQDPLPSVPPIFKHTPNWLRWRLENVDGRDTKVPYQVNGSKASSTNPATWTDYHTAVAGWTIDSTQGVGFALTKELGIIGFDLDGCRNPATGEITEWAKRIINMLASYTEITPSGTGVRVFVVGKKPDGKFKFHLALSAGFGEKVQIEVYDHARYFTMTGNRLGDATVAERGVTEPYKLCYEIMHEHPTEKVQKDATNTLDDSSSVQIKRSGMVVTTKLALLMHGEIVNRSPFTVNTQGNSIEYPSQSEADMALVTLLAIKHNGDADLIDADFRESSLYRAKWEREDYRNGTIQKAIRSANNLNTKPGSIEIPNALIEPVIAPEPAIETSEPPGIPDFDESVITGAFRKIVDAVCVGTTIPRQYGLHVAKTLACSILTKCKIQLEDCESARSYFIVFGDTGTGKGLAFRRLQKIIDQTQSVDEYVHIIHAVDSDAGLRDAFFEIPLTKNCPILFFVDEIKTLGHKADGKKNPEIIDAIIELANNPTISRTKSKKRVAEKSSKTREDAWLLLYVCAQDGEAYGTAFPRTKVQGLPDRFIPEYSPKVKAGRLPEPDIAAGMEAIGELLRATQSLAGRITMSAEVKNGIDEIWDRQPEEIQQSPRLRQQFMLEMYLTAFSRGSAVAEPQDLAIAVKALDRQKAIRGKLFADEMPNQVGIYTNRLKGIHKDMQHRLRSGVAISTVALSLRDLMTQTFAYKENDLPNFNQAWKAQSAFFLECKVASKSNGHVYKKFVPVPEETDLWLSSDLTQGRAI
jgi:hypothetical protein